MAHQTETCTQFVISSSLTFYGIKGYQTSQKTLYREVYETGDLIIAFMKNDKPQSSSLMRLTELRGGGHCFCSVFNFLS